MLEEIEDIFVVAKERMDYYENILQRIEKEPELILTDLFVEKTSDSLLMYLVNNIEENSLVEFQGYLYRLLIPFLKSKLNINEIDFHFCPNIYPSPLTILYNGISIADIHIYQGLLILKGDEKSIEIEHQIEILNTKLKELNSKLEESEMAKINPLILGGSNPIKLADIVIRKKNYIKGINKDITTNNQEILNMQKEISSLNLILNKAQQEFLQAEYIQERITCRFQNYFKYKIISKEETNS